MAIQDDNTILKKSDLKAYHEAIAPMLGGSFMMSTNVSDYYSTDEKVVGIWTNGKPLYQKTLIYNKSWSGTTAIVIGTLPSDAEDGFIVSGYFINTYTNFGPSGTYFMLNSTGRNVEDTKYDTYSYYNPANKSVVLLTGTNTAGSKVVATVQYTKTTDTASSALTAGCYDINFPNTWPENKEIFFGNGLYGYRATGTANVAANIRWDLVIARNQPNAIIRSQGGGFNTVNEWFCPTPWHYGNPDGTVQNATSMFVGIVEGTKNVNYYIMSSFQGDISYDVWVTYTK